MATTVMTFSVRSASASCAAMIFLLCSSQANAQASLAAENIIDDVAIDYIDDAKQPEHFVFTVIRDARNTDQWYYVPSSPRLTEISTPEGVRPEFSLLRYSKRDATNSVKFEGGGLLQFAVDLSAPGPALDMLKGEIVKRLQAGGGGAPVTIRLAALPFKSATVAVYSPKTGDLIGETPQGVGVAPIFASQKMVFSIPLTELGADVYDALVKGTTGVPVAISFKFNGLTPPAGFKVHVNWDQTFKHYSSDTEFRAQASYFGLWGGSGAYSSQVVREALEKNKDIQIEIIEGEGLTMDKIDEYLQPIVKRINDEILVDLAPPPKIDPASAPATSGGGGWFGSVSGSYAVKDVSLVKKGTETVDFRYSKIQERETVASGFVGVRRYPTDVINSLINVVDNSSWEIAYFSLPPVPPSLDSLDMTVRLENGGKVYDSQFYKWSPAGAWTDANGTKVDRAAFSLLALKKDGGTGAPVNAKFDVQETVAAGGETFGLAQSFGVIENGNSVVAPKSMVDVVTLEPDGLLWKGLDASATLTRVTVTLAAGDRNYSTTFRPIQVDGKPSYPPDRSWVVKRPGVGEQTPITATVVYRIGNKDYSWKSADLRVSSPSLELFLDEVGPSNLLHP